MWVWCQQPLGLPGVHQISNSQCHAILSCGGGCHFGVWVATAEGLGLGSGLTGKTEAQGSGGSEARKTKKLQTVPKQEEAYTSGRLLGKKLGQRQEFHGSMAAYHVASVRKKKLSRDSQNLSLLCWMRMRALSFWIPAIRARPWQEGLLQPQPELSSFLLPAKSCFAESCRWTPAGDGVPC